MSIDTTYVCRFGRQVRTNTTDGALNNAVTTAFYEAHSSAAAVEYACYVYTQVMCAFGVIGALLVLVAMLRDQYNNVLPVRMLLMATVTCDLVLNIAYSFGYLYYGGELLTDATLSETICYLAAVATIAVAAPLKPWCVLMLAFQTFYVLLKPIGWHRGSERSKCRFLGVLLYLGLACGPSRTVLYFLHVPHAVCLNCIDNNFAMTAPEEHAAAYLTQGWQCISLVANCMNIGLAIYFAVHAAVFLQKSNKPPPTNSQPAAKVEYAGVAQTATAVLPQATQGADPTAAADRNQAAQFLLVTTTQYVVVVFLLLILFIFEMFMQRHRKSSAVGCQTVAEFLDEVQGSRLRTAIDCFRRIVVPVTFSCRFYVLFACVPAFRSEVITMFRELYVAIKEILEIIATTDI